MIPSGGSIANPQRYIATPTGNNPRTEDTEYKLLAHIANKLKKATGDIYGEIDLHSDFPVCPSCSLVFDQFKQEFPNININVTVGKSE